MEALIKIREAIFEEEKKPDINSERRDYLHRWWQRFTITLGTLDRDMVWLDILSFIIWWNEWKGIEDITETKLGSGPADKLIQAIKLP